MALTVKNLLKFRMISGEFMSIILVTGDTAYPNTGATIGYPIAASTFGLNSFASTSDFAAYAGNSGPITANAYFVLSNLALSGSAGGSFSEPDSVTGNLRCYGPTGTEVSNSATAVANIAVLMALGH
jgi:hypothetical protein